MPGAQRLATCSELATLMPVMKTSAVRGEWTGSAAGKLNFWPVAVPLICFAWFWLEAINQLRPEWSLNPQYGYGWSVPFLALYLFWKRWTTRPASQPVGSWIWSALGMIGCAVAFLPIRFVAEANPDWRMLSWALALSCVIASLSFLYLVGGKGWIFHFAFPCIFFLVAVPWPAQLEQFV